MRERVPLRIQVLAGVLLLANATFAESPRPSPSPLTPQQRMDRVQAAIERTRTERDLPVAFVQKEMSPARRQQRNEHFNDKASVAITDDPNDMGSRRVFTHEQLRMIGMPGPQSDAIVVGSVESAQSFLSADQSNIYSEFGVRVKSVLKGHAGRGLEVGRVVPVLRRGGGVLFDSGRRVTLRINGQTLPTLGGDYVLFLKEEPGLGAFTVLTGYALEGGTSRALDTGEQFLAYEGLPQAEILRLAADSAK